MANKSVDVYLSQDNVQEILNWMKEGGHNIVKLTWTSDPIWWDVVLNSCPYGKENYKISLSERDEENL